MANITQPTEVLGIFITKDEVANLNLEHIHVTDFAIQTILQSIRLNQKAQEETIDRMVDRTPNFFTLEPEEQITKIKTALTYETVIEYLRLNNIIREGIDMLETGLDKEGSIIVSAYYVSKTDLTNQVFEGSMTEDLELQLEKEMNILDGSINIYDEAKKKMDAMKENNVVPFQNREQRRLAKSQTKVRLPHK